MNHQLAEDVAAASAAYAFNVLQEIMALPAPEAYQRLFELFRVAILAFEDGQSSWFAAPGLSESM